jgi:hypothetical protein
MSDMFLNQEELATLTGRKMKSKQIEALRRMGLLFHVNAVGKPVVPPRGDGRAARSYGDDETYLEAGGTHHLINHHAFVTVD